MYTWQGRHCCGDRALLHRTRTCALSKVQRHFRPVPLKIISVSKSNDAASDFAESWLDKIKRYSSVDMHTVRINPKGASDIDTIKAGEAERVLKLIQPRDLVVVLDERGKDITSVQLANLIADAGDSGVTCLALCIGGPYGHNDAVRQRADHMIRLSSLVLNHQVARIVLLEAVYRSYTMLRGEPYHH